VTKDSWKTIKEGKTEFEIIQDAERIYDASVFYNPKMVINRDLTLLMLETISKILSKPLTFVDALAGTGIRSIRVLNELSKTSIKHLFINDKNPKAVEIIQKNVLAREDVDQIDISHSDALDLLYTFIMQGQLLDVIDIDPFGSPISFIETSLTALKRNEGFLFVTATDLQVLCGKYSDACLRIYNSYPTRHYPCHEVALRILLYNILISAGRLGLEIKPILSYHHEHFLRIKIKVEKSKEAANDQHKDIGFLIFCTHCSYYHTVPMIEKSESNICPICENQLEKAGPLWLGNLYDRAYLLKLSNQLDKLDLPSKNKIKKLLDFTIEEIDEFPFFYDFPRVTRQVEKKGIKIQDIVDALNERGFRASRTVFNPEGLKTNAKYDELIHIIKMF
jgi:tRNA (guanine26-N2/guanine27-N2)-dimethyltransferase